MSTQVIFTTDPRLKKRVIHKLRTEGMTLKNLLNNCLRDYELGKIRFAMAYEQEPEGKVLKVTPDIQEAMDDIDAVVKKKYARHL